VPTINLDFYPTFAKITGYDIPDEHMTDGASLAPFIRGENDGEALAQRLFSWHYPLEQPHNLGGRRPEIPTNVGAGCTMRDPASPPPESVIIRTA